MEPIKRQKHSLQSQLASFATDCLEDAFSEAGVAEAIVQSWALAEELLSEETHDPLPMPIACCAGYTHCCMMYFEAASVRRLGEKARRTRQNDRRAEESYREDGVYDQAR